MYAQSERNLLNGNISSRCLHNMANFGPLTAEIGLPVWGNPANFNGFCVLASLLHRRRLTAVNKTFDDVWPSLLGSYTIYTLLVALAPNGFLPHAKFTLRPSLAFSYIGSITARHSSSGRQPNFVAWYKEWNYGCFIDGATYIRLGGHHVWHPPTF